MGRRMTQDGVNVIKLHGGRHGTGGVLRVISEPYPSFFTRECEFMSYFPCQIGCKGEREK